MNPIEDRLRASLHAQADEVEPSQELWRETNRRIDRRQRRRTLGWSLAGLATAAAAVVGVLVVADLGVDLPVPEVAGVPDSEDPGEARDPSDDPSEDAGDDVAEEADPDAVPDGGGAVAEVVPRLTASGATIELQAADGEVLDRLVLPAEGSSSVLSLAVRPGSTPDALTAAVLTEAEGMVDMRVVRRDADGFGIEVVAAAHRPTSGVDPLDVSGPVFSPDGTSLAWLEGGQATTLRTIGWDDDGPGTGERATDNASFILGGAPTQLRLQDWVAGAGTGEFVLRATGTTSTSWFAIPLLRQSDGAWAQEPDARVEPIDAPDDLDTVGRAATRAEGSLAAPVR